MIWFEIAGKRITDAQLRDLVEKGKTRKGKWPRPGQAMEVAGRLVLDANAAREGGAAYFRAGLKQARGKPLPASIAIFVS